MNEQPQTPAQDDEVETTTGSHAKVRPAYLDSSVSESTRELRDQARRRRDAEEKLQQHLLEAKDHTPNADTHPHPTPEDAGRREDAG
ncbi:MAG TPA: hypothetical protein VIQ52_00415 [Arthrobacter sp.]